MDDRSPNADLRHYSKRIKLLRKILPLMAVALLLILGLAANPEWRRALSPPENQADRLRIDRPVFSGRLTDLRPFRLTATEGRQKADGVIAMQVPDLVIDADNPQGRLALTALRADYRAAAGEAFLSGQVQLRDAGGTVVRSEQMRADMNSGIVTASAVSMRGPAGRVRALAMRADTKIRHYRFADAVMRLRETAR